MNSEKGRNALKDIWHKIFLILRDYSLETPFDAEVLTALVTSFSLGLNEKSDPADECILMQRFVAYLKMALGKEEHKACILANKSQESHNADGRLFGKPVWDFTYPQSNFFITQNDYIGCSISSISPGDVIFVASGCTFPLILRPELKAFRIRGFAYIHGLMHAEKSSDLQVFKIQ
ncbi:hypothetical protein MMC25_003751 [Agyrium rufum]|nr:hypothetical protein [Agyrium rufum]